MFDIHIFLELYLQKIVKFESFILPPCLFSLREILWLLRLGQGRYGCRRALALEMIHAFQQPGKFPKDVLDGGRKELRCTFSSANLSAISRPIPVAAPVRTTFFLLNDNMIPPYKAKLL